MDMLLQILKSKLQNVIVTDANIEYQGSLTLDPALMDVAGMRPYERVEVNSVNGKHRITTYILKGTKRGSGQVELNGGAANFFKPGDEIHVNCFAIIDEQNANDFDRLPMIVHTVFDGKGNFIS